MTCSNCATENPAGRRFCDNCGTPLAAACPNCGAANRADARFCGSCGFALDGSATPTAGERAAAQAGGAGTGGAGTGGAGAPGQASERRLVSVLFADLVGFTPFAEERDPEAVRDTLSRYFDTARAVIERHGGAVEKFIGDAVMAVWGSPVAHEDDAERAVRAALELVTAVAAMGDELQARAAVVSGEAAVAVGASDQAMVAGDLVNTCARLQAVAPPGTVLVGEATMHAASGVVAFEPAGEQALKGKAASVTAWRALHVKSSRGFRASSEAEALEPPFVGRAAELSLLKDHVHAATRDGKARLVTVLGTAGIGKSRLAWELQKYLDGLVETVYWHRGRSPSYGDGISFWALGEMVRRRAGLAEADDEATTRERVAATVAEQLADPADRRLVEPALLALLGVGEPPPGGRDVLFAAWRLFFEGIARRGTTVLLFEDLQFADSGLLDFIDHLLEWSKASPIVVLALSRPDLLERRPDFGRAARHFTSLPLEPLGDEDMLALLAGIVPDLDAAAAEAIVRRADGVPLYAVETIRMLVADGRLELREDGTCRLVSALGALAVPDTLRSLISSRLDALDPSERSLVRLASVLGQTVPLDSLAEISGIPAAELSAQLRPLVRREVLGVEADPRSPDRGQYRFVQGVIREVAYGTLSRRERRERHLAVARYFEARGDDEFAGVLASHYLSAHEASEPGPEADAVATQARLALRGAAERAATLGAHDRALAYLRQALHVAPDPSDRAELLERAAAAANAAGGYDESERMAREATEAYRTLGPLAEAARAQGQLGMILVNAGHMSAAIDEFEQAIADLGEGEPEIRADLESRLSRAYMRANQHERAIAAGDRALEIAEARSQEAVVAEAMVNKGAALLFQGRWREGGALIEGAIRMADRLEAPDLQLRARNNLAAAIYEDDPLRAGALYVETLELARRLGLRNNVNFVTPNWAVHCLTISRDWDAAIAALEEAYDAAQSEADRGRQLSVLVNIRSLRGEDVAADMARVERMFAGIDDPTVAAQRHIQRAESAMLSGDLETAVAESERTLDTESRIWPAVTIIARAAVLRKDRRWAELAVRRAAELASTGRIVDSIRRHVAAIVAALDGRASEALSGFLAAHELLRELGVDGFMARLAVHAPMLLPGEPQARAMAEEARPIFERVGAKMLVAWVDEALAVARAADDSSAQPTAGAREPADSARAPAGGSPQPPDSSPVAGSL